ncbi:MAG: Leu/Phe/Val dehydrogenase [Egibacteraceae bacterium]
MEGPFSLLEGHEQVVFGNDAETGLRCIVAIYSTALGPALGGTRFFPYLTERDALIDALRLAKAMAYKAACAGLDLGGGKAVIIGDPRTHKTEPLLRAYGRIVASLGGRYITACDVGTDPADMAVVSRETRWATGTDPVEGGAGDSGILTAWGTYVAIKACAQARWGSQDLSDRHIAIQGCGKVGRRLAEHLSAEGAKLSVADVDEAAAAECAERFRAEVVTPDKIHALDADVFSPNALGAVLNDETIPELQCAVVAGAANNQLAEDRHGLCLAEAGILYAPDYVANAGGIIQVADELHLHGYSEARARARVDAIRERLLEVFARAERERVSTAEAADRIAEERMAAVSRLGRFWLP